MTPPARKEHDLTPLAVVAAYLVAAVVFTWPLALQPTGVIAAPVGAGDPYLNLWILGWDLESLSRQPASILNGTVFNANIFHPARQTLAYSDHLILQAVGVWPVYWLTRDVVLCYNVLLFGSLFLSAVAMYAFALTVAGSRTAAFAAGLVWGFWPYRFAHLIHLQLQALYFMPLTFLFLHRVMAGKRKRDAAWLGVTAGLQAISSAYYGVIGAIGIAVAAVVLAAVVGRWRSTVLLRRLMLAGIVGLLLAGPIILIYTQVQRREGFGRNLYEAARHAATPGSYGQVPESNLLYGRSGLLPSAAGHERQLYPGAVVVALALVGVASARRRDAVPAAAAMLAVIATGLVLSLGPEGVRSVYAAAHRLVFGFHAVRAPARFAVLVTFGLAVLAALGIRHLQRSATARGARAGLAVPAPHLVHSIPILLVALLALEYLNAPIAFAAAPRRHSSVAEWLRDVEEPGAVAYLPVHLDLKNTPFMIDSLLHRRPIVNGYSGNRPGFYTALTDTLRDFPNAEGLWTLHDMNVRFIVSPRALSTSEWPLVERARFGEGGALFDGPAIIYELRWTPEAEARFAAPPPPAPGPPPFRIGERAVYRVTWAGGLSTLPAGHATITVDAPPGSSPAGARYRFSAVAETADWVSRFFEARDTFETITDGQLLPLRHERHLREGRRTQDLTVTFDHSRGTVTRGTAAEDAVTFRIPAGTRDPVSAFFYARSVSLDSGQRVRVPVNDAGKNLTLDIPPGRRETITYDGRDVDTLRIDPRIVQQDSSDDPIRMTIWISTDRQRIPLIIEVTAAFGAIRAELAERE